MKPCNKQALTFQVVFSGCRIFLCGDYSRCNKPRGGPAISDEAVKYASAGSRRRLLLAKGPVRLGGAWAGPLLPLQPSHLLMQKRAPAHQLQLLIYQRMLAQSVRRGPARARNAPGLWRAAPRREMARDGCKRQGLGNTQRADTKQAGRAGR